MSEGVYVLIGTIIGSVVSLLGVHFTNQYNRKIEEKKMNFSLLIDAKKITLSLLIEKKCAIELFIKRCPTFNFIGKMESDEVNVNDEYKFILKFVEQKSHFFVDSSEFQRLNNIIEYKEDYSPSDMVHLQYSYILDFHKLIRSELDKVMKKIGKEFDIKV